MSRSLKLGPIPDDKPIRLTIALPAAFVRDLDAYAEAYAAENAGRRLELRKLIPYMLEAFIRSDRAFAKRRGALGPHGTTREIGASSRGEEN